MRYTAIGLILLFAFAGALQWRSRASSQGKEVDDGRALALLEASRLISEPSPAPAPRILRPITQASAQPATSLAAIEMATRAPDLPQAVQYRARSVSEPSGATAGTSVDGANFARKPAFLGPADRDAIAASAARSPEDPNPLARSQRSIRHAQTQSAIPAQIEDGKPLHSDKDALYGMAIRGDLRTRGEHDCPFALAAISSNERNPRAQLRKADGAVPGVERSDWYAVGDSPGAGWRVLAIAPGKVLLLDPQGSVISLQGRDMTPVGTGDTLSPPTGATPRRNVR